MDNIKNKAKMSKIFQKITLGKTTTNESKYKNENINANITTNLNLNSNNKNEIYNQKKLSLFNKNKNILVKSRNSLFLEKNIETSPPITENEENSKKININIINNDNINDNITNKEKYEKEPILIPKKINNIKYPNEQIYDKLSQKTNLFQEFLERHHLILNNSSAKKQKSYNYDSNIISNKMYGTISNNLYNYDNYNENYNKNIYLINNQNILLKEGENYDYLNKKNAYTQISLRKNINNKNTDIPENINYKIINLDNNKYNSSLNKRRYNTRNNEELILPIKNIFKTFQVNKYKNIINNIKEDFPTKISPSFGRTGYSVYKKNDKQKKSIIKNTKNINIYKKPKNQSHSEFDLGLAPSKILKIYT